MPRDYWRVIAPVVGCLGLAAIPAAYVAGFGQADYLRQTGCQTTEPGPASNQQKHECATQGDTDRAGVPRIAERIISNPEPQNADDRERRDLAAQEATAVWAFWVVFFSALQALISAVGLVALVYTLRQTDKSLWLAREANKHSEDTAKCQLRAYLGISDYEFDPITFETFNTSARITIEAKNFGQTPARGALCFIKVACTPWGSDPEWPKKWDYESVALPADVQPGAPLARDIAMPDRTIEVMEELTSGTYAFYVLVKMVYDDVFGFRHNQDTLLYARGKRYLRGELGICAQTQETSEKSG